MLSIILRLLSEGVVKLTYKIVHFLNSLSEEIKCLIISFSIQLGLQNLLIEFGCKGFHYLSLFLLETRDSGSKIVVE